MPGAVEVILRTEGDRTFVYKVYIKGEERPRGLTDGRDFESWAPYAARGSFVFVHDPSLAV
ncbi:MAG: hypothetical protein QT00_C0002G0128 [archaeon GW2011_AR5]|nr:MAG: hypothetical protein QT00_C0002G0128 [archaeon GW2011_AR5]